VTLRAPVPSLRRRQTVVLTYTVFTRRSFAPYGNLAGRKMVGCARGSLGLGLGPLGATWRRPGPPRPRRRAGHGWCGLGSRLEVGGSSAEHVAISRHDSIYVVFGGPARQIRFLPAQHADFANHRDAIPPCFTDSGWPIYIGRQGTVFPPHTPCRPRMPG